MDEPTQTTWNLFMKILLWCSFLSMFNHKKLFIRRFLYFNALKNWLLLTQLLFKFKIPLLKPKPVIKFNGFKTWIPQHSFNHLTQFGMITITSKCQKNVYIYYNLKISRTSYILFGSYDFLDTSINYHFYHIPFH
jgi:hypothetical protein